MNRIFHQFPVITSYVLSLWLCFLALRGYEIMQMHLSGDDRGTKLSYVLSGILFDLFLSLLITGIYSVFQFVAAAFRRKITGLFHFLGLIALVADFALIQYFLLMRVPLDESLFFFSWSELKLIVGVGNRLSMGVVAGLAGLTAFYFLLAAAIRRFHLFRRESVSKWICIAGFIACCFCWFSIYRNEENPRAAALINNKLAFFTGRSMAYFMGNNDQQMAVIPADFQKLDPAFLSSGTVDGIYPLIHDLPDENALLPYFDRKSEKPPNIVFIIVESLSSDFVGKYAGQTGHLMPFLDSLSQRSLYFPNVLSTAERTHNALPAILASVPNAPEGKMLQCMEFPDHWSLPALLKKHYYSRFYCGVDLTFSNMRGYMNYTQTDYLVGNWNKCYSKTTNSQWGYPDGVLFSQSLDDLNKLQTNKSRLDVFLTISTHDPFLYPETEKYTRFVQEQIRKCPVKNVATREIENNASAFGSYSYCDAQIREFFRKIQQRQDFDNTIFIITGDHGTELYRSNEIAAYKVPVIIYSPLLKKTGVFPAVSTHLDLTPSILNLLRLGYLDDLPRSVPFIGQELDMRPEFHVDRSLPFSSTLLKNRDVLLNGKAMLYGSVYSVGKDLQLTRVNNKKMQRNLTHQLELYNAFSRYVMVQDKIVPPLLSRQFLADNSLEVLFESKSEPGTADLKKELIDIGTFPKLPASSKSVRVAFHCLVWMTSENDLKTMQGMSVSIENEEGHKVLFYGVAEPVLRKRFQANNWNEIEYTLTVQMKDLPEKLKKDNNFKFYLNNWEKRSAPLHMKRFQTIVSGN